MKRQSELHLELTTNSDVAKKPVQHLAKVLKLIGLKQKLVKTTRHKDIKTYHYALSAERLTKANQIIANRKSATDWDYVNKLYDFKYTEIDEEWIDGIKYGFDY